MFLVLFFMNCTYAEDYLCIIDYKELSWFLSLIRIFRSSKYPRWRGFLCCKCLHIMLSVLLHNVQNEHLAHLERVEMSNSMHRCIMLLLFLRKLEENLK